MLHRVVILGAFGLLVFSLIGYLAPLYWVFDLFSHFRVQYLTVGILGLGASLITRTKVSTLSFLVTVCINVVLIVPLYWPRSAPATAHSKFSILSYNTWRRNTDWPRIEVAIKTHSADIVDLTKTTPQVRSGAETLVDHFDVFRAGLDVLLVNRSSLLRLKHAESPPEEIGSGIGA